MYCSMCGTVLRADLVCPSCHYSLFPKVYHTEDACGGHFLRVEVPCPLSGSMRAGATMNGRYREILDVPLETTPETRFELANAESLYIQIVFPERTFTCRLVPRNERIPVHTGNIIVKGHASQHGACVGDIIVNSTIPSLLEQREPGTFSKLVFVEQTAPTQPNHPKFLRKGTTLTLDHLQSVPSLEAWKASLDVHLQHDIQSLNLNYSKLCDEHIAVLCVLDQLQSVNLSYCTKITDQSIGAWLKLPSLKSLNLECCPGITVAGLNALLTADPSRTWRVRVGGTNCGVTYAEMAELPAKTLGGVRDGYVRTAEWFELGAAYDT